MGDRVRAAEEKTEEKPAAPVIVRPAPVASNRESADLLSGPGTDAARRGDVAVLGGPAGNRAVAQLLGPASADPAIDWIESLPAHIKQQIDNFSAAQEKAADTGNEKLADARTRNRQTFMDTMRWAMGDDDTVIQQHFQAIAPIDVGGGEELWAHSSTRERLAAVKAELEAQGIPMPQTTVGLGMRGDHLSRGTKGRTWFTHAVGFAVDWRAYQTPRITDDKLITLFDVVTGGRPDMKTSVEGDTRIDLEIKMGQGKADPAEAKKLLDSVDAEYTRLTQASETFKTDLPKETLDRLGEVEQARFAVGTARKALARLKARKKPKAATADEIAAAEKAVTDAQERYDKLVAAVVPDLPKLFEPWTKKIDERIAAIDQEFTDAGVDQKQLTSDYGLKEQDKKIKQVRKDEATLAKAKIKDEAKLAQLHQQAQEMAEDLAERRKYRADTTTALGAKKVQALIDEKFKLITLRGLKEGLITNANGFVFRTKLATDDPAIDQLLGLMPENRGGFFTPDAAGGEAQAKAGQFSGEHGYGLAFIKSMVSHGFEAGMAWRGGSDPMHFELAEGRKFLKTAGKSPLGS